MHQLVGLANNNYYCCVFLIVIFVSPISSTFINWNLLGRRTVSSFHSFIHSFNCLHQYGHTGMYCMGYNPILSFFIFLLKLFQHFHWKAPSGWFLCPLDMPHLSVSTSLFSAVTRYSSFILCFPALDLQSTTFSRSLSSFDWRYYNNLSSIIIYLKIEIHSSQRYYFLLILYFHSNPPPRILS